MQVCGAACFSSCLSQICIPVGNALAIVMLLVMATWAYCPRICCKVYCLSYTVSRKLHAQICELYQEVWLKVTTSIQGRALTGRKRWASNQSQLPLGGSWEPCLSIPCLVCLFPVFWWLLSDPNLRKKVAIQYFLKYSTLEVHIRT